MTTMATAGRATLFSGATVAIGLALLVFMPLPFMRSMGVGGLLVPLFSIAASATFLPALLAVLGRKINRFRVVPRARARGARRGSSRASGPGSPARSCGDPVAYLVGAGGLMIALAIPALQLHLTGGDNRGMPLDDRGDARAGSCSRARSAPAPWRRTRSRSTPAPGGALARHGGRREAAGRRAQA